ncbi:hypothetical protein [Nannocystis pusilla]|uniref:hypothetical protein n=1 Tax=Nannocystis pusilla TaxID=889268 RepID=UPI003B7CCD3D
MGGNGKAELPATFISIPPLGFAWPFWNAWRDAGDAATIVALDLAGDETATALRRLAETWRATQAQAQVP